METLNLNTLRETARLLACFVRDTLADWGIHTMAIDTQRLLKLLRAARRVGL